MFEGVSEVSDLLSTDLSLAAILGEVEDRGSHVVVRTPHNPGFYHGNFLLLPGPPEDLDLWCARFEDAFGPEVEHRCFTWCGEHITPLTEARARELGFSPDAGVALALDSPPPVPPTPLPKSPEKASPDTRLPDTTWPDRRLPDTRLPDTRLPDTRLPDTRLPDTRMPDARLPDTRLPDTAWTVRPLDPTSEFERFEALNIVCDPADATGTESYKTFKSRLRATVHTWMSTGHATWWGAFFGEELVGQCGFAVFGDLGRFQSVETHPEFRRLGVCSALIATVAGHGFRQLGCRRVLLAADGAGPAIGLYRRLGFVEDGDVRSLVRQSDPLQVLAETFARHPDVRSLLCAAFETPAEAELVDELRQVEGTIGLVAARSGAVQGHIFFTPIEVRDGDDVWSAIALGPMAVRPELHGLGIGTRLVQAGLDACRSAGHEVCFVLGHPTYYPRFGFEPARPLSITSQWDVPDDVFMVAELTPGALRGRKGRVKYAAAFDNV